MDRVFLCGPLAHPALRAAILARDTEGRLAALSGHVLRGAGAQAVLCDGQGEVAGPLLEVTPEDLARLDFHQVAAGLLPGSLPVEGAPARCYFPGPDCVPEGPWDEVAWLARWAPTVVATARDVMQLRGTVPAEAVRARYWLMMVRGSSRVRADAEQGATHLRRAALPGDTAVDCRRQVYANYFAVEEYDLAFRQFGGGMSATVNRAVFVSGDAVTVLPYDARRDRVLLVEQWRAGPMARGDGQPWLLETIAGRIDPGESPEEAARREAVEEAGITLGALLPVSAYYPSPGAKAEYLYSYVALADLPDGSAGIFGVEGEAEDIRGHLVGFDRMMDLVASGEICNAPLLLTALWLQRERPRLRAEAGV